MMRRGIMFFDIYEQNWKIWIGQQEYETLSGTKFEIRIQNRYYQAWLGKCGQEWFVTLEDDVTFGLRLGEIYKVRVIKEDLIPAICLPF